MFIIQSTDGELVHFYHLDKFSSEGRHPVTMKRIYYPYWSREMEGCLHFESIEKAEETYNEYKPLKNEAWDVMIVEVVVQRAKRLY